VNLLENSPPPEVRSALSPISWGNTLAVAALIAVSILGGASLYCGSLKSGLALLRGQSVYFSSNEVILGTVSPGQVSSGWFELANLTSRTVTIYGAHKHCECAIVSDLPVEIPPRTHAKIWFSVSTSQGELRSVVSTVVDLFVDVPESPIPLTLTVNLDHAGS
jgi:hypothetical protein